MSSAWNIALSGLRACEIKTAVNASNIANINTEGFKKSRVTLQEAANGGVQVTLSQVNLPGVPLGMNAETGEVSESSSVDLAESFVDQRVTTHTFAANATTVRTAAEMQQTLLDILA
jgi:flagellar basal-body rod protein FlgC